MMGAFQFPRKGGAFLLIVIAEGFEIGITKSLAQDKTKQNRSKQSTRRHDRFELLQGFVVTDVKVHECNSCTDVCLVSKSNSKKKAQDGSFFDVRVELRERKGG